MSKSVTLLLVLVLLALCVVVFLPVKANPYKDHKSVSSAPALKRPTITILSPEENAFYSNDGSIILWFYVNGPESPYLLTKYLTEVDWKGDWMQDAKTYTPDNSRNFFEFYLNITGIPDGRHSINITAFGAGGYAEGLTWYQFSTQNSSSVNFTIDTIPIVSFLSFENRTFETSDAPLNFTVDQSVSKITYCLDGQDNVTVSGNATLTGLSNGDHNVTVYALDEAGNLGASETIHFNVARPPEPEPEPFPTTLVAAASVAAIALVSVGLLIYFKKRKK